eukprot:1135863-Prymnesium_polylepis.1
MPAKHFFGNYTMLQRKGTCEHPTYDIDYHPHIKSIEECLDLCELYRKRHQHTQPGTPEFRLKVRDMCAAVAYSPKQKMCLLRRRCLDRGSVKLGECPHSRQWCHLVRGPMKPPRLHLDNYTRLKRSGGCQYSLYDIGTPIVDVTRRECFRRCDALHERH